MHKWKEELRIEKNGGGMSWETCREADYLDELVEITPVMGALFMYFFEKFRVQGLGLSFRAAMWNGTSLLSHYVTNFVRAVH